MKTGGGLHVAQLIAIGKADLTLDVTGKATQAAAITAAGLELLGGTFAFTGAPNDVTTLAAKTSGGVAFRDANDLTVGLVNATAGITTAGGDVLLQTANRLTIARVLALGSGDFTADSTGTTFVNVAPAHAAAATIAGDSLTFNGAVELQSAAVLSGATAVTFNRALDSQNGKANNLTINSPLTFFMAAVGAAGAGPWGRSRRTPRAARGSAAAL